MDPKHHLTTTRCAHVAAVAVASLAVISSACGAADDLPPDHAADASATIEHDAGPLADGAVIEADVAHADSVQAPPDSADRPLDAGDAAPDRSDALPQDASSLDAEGGDAAPTHECDVLAYGAKGDGKTIDTTAIQAAI